MRMSLREPGRVVEFETGLQWRVIFPDVDLYPWRLVAAIIAMALMLYGLIWESG